MSLRPIRLFALLVPALVLAAPALAGSLDKEPIRAAVRAKRPQLKACYEHALERDPMLAGKIVVRFVIDPARLAAEEATITDQTTLADPDMQACVLETVESMTFDYALSDMAKPLTVVYPFVFSPGDVAAAQ